MYSFIREHFDQSKLTYTARLDDDASLREQGKHD